MHDVPNKAYLAEVYVCGTSYRDMAQLLDAHLPEEKIAAMAFQSEGVKGWPDTMQGVKPERGVWACKYRHGLSIYRCVNGARIELD